MAVADGKSYTRPFVRSLDFDHEKGNLFIVGGGFAGLHACRTMRKEFNVTLIDAKEYFEFYPGILRAYLQPAEHGKLSALYQHTCDLMRCKFVWGEVTHINGIERRVHVKCMADKSEQNYEFDYLIVSCGSQYGLYMSSALRPASAAECLWYPTFLEKVIQTESCWGQLDERFLSGRRAHFENERQAIEKIANDKGTIVVVGAGFVGVEWATEVKHYFPDIDVVVVEARGECIGVMPPRCKEYCQRYMERVGIRTIYNFNYKTLLQPGTEREEADPKELERAGIDGPVARVYMAVGVRSINQFLPESCLEKFQTCPVTGDVTRGGFIRCNEEMQVISQAEDGGGSELFSGGRVYAAGSCCSVQGFRFPKNSFPGEDMASVACNNIRVAEKYGNSSYGGCFRFLKPNKVRKIQWSFGMGFCATSLGPDDATLVALSTSEPGSGYTVATGLVAALKKEFIRWSKVDQCRMGCLGQLIWFFVH